MVNEKEKKAEVVDITIQIVNKIKRKVYEKLKEYQRLKEEM